MFPYIPGKHWHTKADIFKIKGENKLLMSSQIKQICLNMGWHVLDLSIIIMTVNSITLL